MKRVAVILVAVMGAGCAYGETGHDLAGEWRFADIRQASTLPDANTPPLFDIITFGPASQITLHDSLRRQEFKGQYTEKQGNLSWTFQPKDTPSPVEHAVHYSFSDDGALILRSAKAKHSEEQNVEWVFLRPARFLPNITISGDWVAKDVDGRTDLHRSLRSDGTFGSSSGKSKAEDSWGVCRLWRTNNNALMLTTLLWVQGEGGFAMFEVVTLQGNEMKSTLRIPPGFPSQPPRIWRRAPPGSAKP